VKYLLDTHTLLWIVDNDSRLGANVKAIFLNDDNDIFVSTASIWELSIKMSLKKLQIPGTLSEFVESDIRGNKIDILSIELRHLYQLVNLTFFHRDPFDRLLIAQAIVDDIPILSYDAIFDNYPVQRVW